LLFRQSSLPMLRKLHVFTEAEFSTGGIWKRCDQVGRNPELNSVTIAIRSLSSPGTRPVSNSSKTNNGNSTYRLVSPCFAVQPGRREGRRESRREKTVNCMRWSGNLVQDSNFPNHTISKSPGVLRSVLNSTSMKSRKEWPPKRHGSPEISARQARPKL
jgi:hypothetical protein